MDDIFVMYDLEIWWMTLKNNRASLLWYFKLCVSLYSHRSIETGVTVRKHPILCKMDDFFSSTTLNFDRWPWKTYRAPLPCYFKLCASFHSHLCIQTGVTFRKRPIWVKINDFLSHVILKFYGWPWKTIGHLFYAASSFVHYFILYNGWSCNCGC